MLSHIDRGDLAGAARMFAEPVSLTVDGKDRIMAPAAFVQMVARCRFTSVEARGPGSNTEVSWACDEYSHRAKQIVAEVRGKSGRLFVDNVEVRKVAAVVPVVLGPIQ